MPHLCESMRGAHPLLSRVQGSSGIPGPTSNTDLRAIGWDESFLMDRGGETAREETDHVRPEEQAAQPSLQPSYRKLPKKGPSRSLQIHPRSPQKHPKTLKTPQDPPKSPPKSPQDHPKLTPKSLSPKRPSTVTPENPAPNFPKSPEKPGGDAKPGFAQPSSLLLQHQTCSVHR